MLAAEKLGCSVFELMARPDAVYWRDWAITARGAENWAKHYQAQQRKTGGYTGL